MHVGIDNIIFRSKISYIMDTMRQNCTKSALIAIWKLINYVYEQKTEGSRPCSATRVYEWRRSAVLRFLLRYHNLYCCYFQTSFTQLVLWELGAIKRLIGYYLFTTYFTTVYKCFPFIFYFHPRGPLIVRELPNTLETLWLLKYIYIVFYLFIDSPMCDTWLLQKDG